LFRIQKMVGVTNHFLWLAGSILSGFQEFGGMQKARIIRCKWENQNIDPDKALP
jgi:hypothetical protein